MDKKLLESVMKLYSISIRVDCYSDDELGERYAFVIDGLSPENQVGKMYQSKEDAMHYARHLVYSTWLLGGL
jgi:hypothetical protein